MTVEMKAVESSNVESVGYDAAASKLYVKFLNGSTYTYQGVPVEKYNELLGAESVGKYLNQHIKPVFPVEKI